MMTDAAYLELLAGFGQSIEAAQRSLTIARELAEAHRSGQRPPEAVITAYLHGMERDEARGWRNCAKACSDSNRGFGRIKMRADERCPLQRRKPVQ